VKLQHFDTIVGPLRVYRNLTHGNQPQCLIRMFEWYCDQQEKHFEKVIADFS